MNKTTSLTRSISYWLLLVLSLASVAVGGWLVYDQTTTMATALVTGTATGVEVYVGQPLIVVGAVVLGAGVIGILIALGLTAAKALMPAQAPVAVEPIDWTSEPQPAPQVAEIDQPETAQTAGTDDGSDADEERDAQNGSSGSTATATKISVK
ncbi:hypothetical protein [Microbacterium abyssi]|uniref:hypothetical protein n=1 Tax=Microbacterium abyssi TaxID=2782166 RepID=UPI00188721AE|nr:hypothetical protein [Microbacterium sp. A18JL241]